MLGRCFGRVLWLLAALGSAACRAGGAPAAVPMPARLAAEDPDDSTVTLDLLAEFIVPAGLTIDGTRFGSVSGLVQDVESGQWVGAVDERDHSRLVWMDVVTSPVFRVTPRRFTFLRAAAPDVSPEVAGQADLEGIVAMPDGSFAAIDEGHQVGSKAWQPQILRIQRDGRVTSVSAAPAAYRIPPPGGSTGVRPNLGLESLTRMPNGHLMSGLEQPLMQDDVPSHYGQGGLGRLVEFAPEGDGFHPVREYAYHLAATPRMNGYDGLCKDGENGLTDLLALSDTTFLALERSCLVNTRTKAVHNSARIFEVTVEGAEDVSGRGSLREGSPPHAVHKRRVIDIRKIEDRLSPALAQLENFEGLSFGPAPPGGGSGRTVLVLSDDNFRVAQKTAILWFGLGGPSTAR